MYVYFTMSMVLHLFLRESHEFPVVETSFVDEVILVVYLMFVMCLS